jgi:hypothetical protein
MAACQLFINRDTNNKIAALILVEGRAAIIFHSKTKTKNLPSKSHQSST